MLRFLHQLISSWCYFTFHIRWITWELYVNLFRGSFSVKSSSSMFVFFISSSNYKPKVIPTYFLMNMCLDNPFCFLLSLCLATRYVLFKIPTLPHTESLLLVPYWTTRTKLWKWRLGLWRRNWGYRGLELLRQVRLRLNRPKSEQLHSALYQHWCIIFSVIELSGGMEGYIILLFIYVLWSIRLLSAVVESAPNWLWIFKVSLSFSFC